MPAIRQPQLTQTHHALLAGTGLAKLMDAQICMSAKPLLC
jgi:hypothetical protein